MPGSDPGPRSIGDRTHPRRSGCVDACDRAEDPEGARIIVPPTTVKVSIATKPVDFRKGMNGLAALIAAEFKLEHYWGVFYVFPIDVDV